MFDPKDKEITIKITHYGWEITYQNRLYFYNSNIKNDDGLSAIKVLLTDLGYHVVTKPIEY